MPITLGNIAPVNSERNAFVCRPRLLGSSIERMESLGTWKCLPSPSAAFMVPCSLRQHLSISSTFLLLVAKLAHFIEFILDVQVAFMHKRYWPPSWVQFTFPAGSEATTAATPGSPGCGYCTNL